MGGKGVETMGVALALSEARFQQSGDDLYLWGRVTKGQRGKAEGGRGKAGVASGKP
jgi:hypothetical protein